jgi:hypothetical protein
VNEGSQTLFPQLPAVGPIMPAWKPERDIERITATMMIVNLQPRQRSWPHMKSERKQAAYVCATCV